MKKFLIILAVLVLLLVLAVAAIPFLFKDKIVQMAKEQANNSLNATVNFNNDISLSIIKSFPNLTLVVNDITVIGKDSFAGDTLVSMKELATTLDVMTVIKGEKIKILSILMEQPNIKAIVSAGGKANWDIAKADEPGAPEADTAASDFNIALKKFEIRDGHVIYDDRQGAMYAELHNLDHTLEGDFTQDQFLMKTLTDVEQLTYTMSGLTYLSKVKSRMKADIDADMKNMKFTFKENEVDLNELQFAFNGWLAMPGDDMDMDITYAAKKSEFKNFLSLIPAVYSKDFKDLQSSGKMAFEGFVKGIYNETRLPAFALKLMVENGMFKYPSLPTPVNNVQMNLEVTNPDGDLNNTRVDLSRLHFDISGDSFEAKMIAVNVMKDPDIDASMVGRINLDNLVSIVPLEEGMKLSGLIISDFKAKGKVSDVEKQNYENFNASGTIEAKNVHYASKDLPQGMDLKSMLLSFTTRTVGLKGFDAKIGNSDMKMDGELSNFFPYFFGKGVLKGNMTMKSNMMDVNQFMSKEETAKTENAPPDTTGSTPVEVPANIDFTMNSTINKMLYTNMEINNLKGTLRVVDRKLSFSQISMNLLGAMITMDGFYETSNPHKPGVSMNFGIQNMDIQKAFATFNTMKKIAPIAERAMGNFSTTITMNTFLDSRMNPIFESLFADGSLSVLHAEIQNVAVFEKLADVLRKPDYKKLALDNVKIHYKVENGRIFTKPFDVKVAGQKLNLAGSTGFDQTIDYKGTVALPKKDLGAINAGLESAMAALNQKAGTSIKMNEMVNVGLGIGGTFTKPTITTNLGDIAKSEANSLKNQAAAELDKAKKELEAKARAEADKYKKQAEDKLNAEKERLRKEAEERTNKEKEKLKKQAEEEAKKKLKGIFK